MRILIAGILGGIVMFIWGVAAHMLIPLGDTGIRQPVAEDVALSSLRQGLGERPGVYMLPSMSTEQMSDPAAVKAYQTKSASAPYAWVVFLPQGQDATQMGPQIARQWASDTLAALALAWVMSLVVVGFASRLGVAVVTALFAWLSALVPYWNWYRFPLDFTVAALVEQVIGWLLAGAVMAWWLGRSTRQPR
jgi:hypothetical protein